MAKDYYKTLGVRKDASKEDIKAAYKKLAKQYHPDINKEAGSAEKFKEINEAYSILGDDTKRANYDRFGTAEEMNFSGEGFREFSFDDAFDIFNSFFGGEVFGRKRRRQRRGEDISIRLDLKFEEAVFGTEKKIEVPKQERCDACSGTGAENGEMKLCGRCNGTGMQKQMYKTPFGVVSQSATCPECDGEGQVISRKCRNCNGTGAIKSKKVLTVKIPAGVDENSTLRIPNEGEVGERGAPSGHLYIELNVKPHEFFERRGNDIYLEYPISFSQAALGAEVRVPTVHGDVTMKIPPGTQSGTVLRLNAKGVPYMDGQGNGDEYVMISVKTPSKLTKRQKELFVDLAKEEAELKPGKKEKGFFSKVKEALH